MKTYILTPLAAVAAFTFALSGCTTSDPNLDNAVTSMTPATEAQLAGEGFQARYEAETRAAGLATAEANTYENLFSDIENTEKYSFLDLAETNSHLSTFVELMRETGMLSTIDYTGRSFTIFAPTNAAFEALPPGQLEELRKSKNRFELIKLLQAHMLPTPLNAAEFHHNQRIQVGSDSYIPIKVDDEGASKPSITVGGATVIKPDVATANGVIHVVDAVITPVSIYDVTEE